MKTLKSLAELYEHVVLNEANKSEGAIADKTGLSKTSEDEVGDLKADQEFFSEVPKPVEGAEKASVKELKHKVEGGSSSKPTMKSGNSGGFKGSAPASEPDTEEAEELENEEDVFPPKNKKTHDESYNMSAFENLLKKTLAEELETEEETSEGTEEGAEEVSEDMEDMEEGTEEGDQEGEEEEGDLVSDLKDLQDKLANILSKLEGGAEENESEGMEDGENYTEDDFDGEFGEEEEQGTFGESVKAKSLSPSKGKGLMKKTNKVGKLKSSGGKAHCGSLKNEPKPKALGDKKGSLLKGTEAKSSVKKGEFFK